MDICMPVYGVNCCPSEHGWKLLFKNVNEGILKLKKENDLLEYKIKRLKNEHNK